MNLAWHIDRLRKMSVPEVYKRIREHLCIYQRRSSYSQFFRSTIAHNTVEIGGKNQATIIGPFMWKKSYKAALKKAGESPVLHAEASHDGYIKKFSVIHTRKIEWPALHQMEILDFFSGKGEVQLRGAFHLGR